MTTRYYIIIIIFLTELNVVQNIKSKNISSNYSFLDYLSLFVI